MAKKKKNRDRRNQQIAESGGLDFGFRQRAILASETSQQLDQALREANVFGCAYGYEPVDGYPGNIPCLTLVCEHEQRMRDAFDCFTQWGASEDGDAVEMAIFFKSGGSYRLCVGPNMERLIERSFVNFQLVETIYMGLTWIKTLDSTHPLLREWSQKLRSRLAPIKVSAALTTSDNGPPRPESVRPISGIPSFVKFDFPIFTEGEGKDHWLYEISEGPKFKKKSKRRNRGPHPMHPKDIAEMRRVVIDTAFPVTRDRIRQTDLFSQIKAVPGYEGIHQSQVEQAVINLITSRELTRGKDHFAEMKDSSNKWWAHVFERFERCDGQDSIGAIELKAILKQLKLDVLYTLSEHGRSPSKKGFREDQKQFVGLGYGGN